MRYIFICALLLSCTGDNDAYSPPPEGPQEVWVCHNPWSEQHGKICNSECLEAGITNKYCWLLRKEECEGELTRSWQVDSCPLFEEVSQ